MIGCQPIKKKMSNIQGKFSYMSQQKQEIKIVVIVSHNYPNKKYKKIAHEKNQLDQLKVGYHN